ncbi:MAG: ATP-binding protein, partial [Spirochaetales bacterium]|nr:ATP-binding protein [Spirochaetales bacterium]
YVNNYFFRFLGYSEEDIYTIDFIEFVHPDHKKLVLDLSRARLAGKEVQDNYEIKVIFKDGSTHWVVISASKVNLKSQQLGLGGMFDITKRKNLEQQIAEEKAQIDKAKKLESMGILAGGIAHDFNNLLTGILGNISLINLYLEENDTAKIKDKLHDVQLVIKRASDLTNQLLTFSKGGLLTLKIASLENIVRENTAFVLSGSNVNYNISKDDNLWKVSVDTGQISQVIQNLIINADQSMPNGGKIDIKLENFSVNENIIITGVEIPEGDYVRVEIKDTGTGIPKDIINKIFDPYFTTKQEGNGLGLATVYSIIEQHEGCICVESERGYGTTFSLYFKKTTHQNINNLPKQHAKQKKSYRKDQKQRRILIMDDELLVLTVAEEIFKNMNFDVDLSGNGTDVLEKIKNSILTGERYNIVLLDLTIPGGMGGKETLHHILNIDPGVNAIATSGYSSDRVMANYKMYGFNGILKKPYTFEDIEKLVENC